MASGDRNYDIATETTQKEILQTVNSFNSNAKPIRMEKISPSSNSTISKTGKGRLFVNANDAVMSLTIDGVKLIEASSLYAPFDIEFSESFALTRGNTNSNVNAVAIFYE